MRNVHRILFSAAALISLCAISVHAKELRIVSWDVESDDNDAVVIARQLTSLGDYDLYGLTSVAPKEVNRYRAAIRKSTGRNFRSVIGETGGSQRIAALYDADRFELAADLELHAYAEKALNDAKSQHRSPLILKLQDRETRRDDEQPVAFYFVVNHFARKNAELRRQQAVGLRLWGQDQSLPIVGVGNYNFDFDIKTLRGNRSFDLFMIDYVWYWVRPEKFVDTQWADADNDGKDDYPNSCQEFGLVVGSAQLWSSKARVIVREGDFPDDSKTSDHRPVELIMSPR